MLKFIAGVAVGFMAYNALLSYAVSDEDTFNELVEKLRDYKGYGNIDGQRNFALTSNSPLQNMSDQTISDLIEGFI